MRPTWPANALFAQDWTLDGLGNFGEFKEDSDTQQPGWETDQDRTVNSANEIQTITGDWITPQYDRAGNMISGPAPGDESTRLHFTYDAWNRLVAVHADDNGEQGDLLAAYERDGLNRRVEKTVTAAGDGPRWVDYYYNANWQLLEEREFDALSAPVESRVYVWSPRYIDAPVLRDRYDDEGQLDESARLYYLGDANFNVTALLQENPQTPGTWQVAERYVYTPYGESTVCDASWSTNPQSPIPNPIRYAGYFLDSETGLYDVRHRAYHSTISTFLVRDPIGYAAGDVNLYRYVGNGPVSHVDPMGLQADSEYPDFGDGTSLPAGVSDETWNYFTEWRNRLRPDLKNDLAWLETQWRSLLYGCIGVVANELGVNLRIAEEKLDLSRCYRARVDAEKELKEINSEGGCCKDGHTNVFGKPAQARLVYMEFRNINPNAPNLVSDPEIEIEDFRRDGQRYDLADDKVWTAIRSPAPGSRLNFDFSIWDPNRKQWLGGDHGQPRNDQPGLSPMRVLTRTEAEFEESRGMDTQFYCVVCEKNFSPPSA